MLNLKDNSIAELDAANFENCSQIKRLILTGNPIKSFNPMIFQKMKRLSSLEIDLHDDACWSTKGKRFDFFIRYIILKRLLRNYLNGMT